MSLTEHQWELELSVVCPYDSIIWRGWAPPGAQPQALSRRKLPACLPPPPPKPPPPVPRVTAPPPMLPAKKPPAPPRPPAAAAPRPPAAAVPAHRPLEPLHLLRNLGVPLVLPAPKRTVRPGWTRHAPWLAVGVALVVSAAFTVPPLVAHLRRPAVQAQATAQPPAHAQAEVAQPAPVPAVPDIPITIKVERPRPVASPLRRDVQSWRLAPSLLASIRRAKRRVRPRKHMRVRFRRPRRPRVSSRVDADALLAAAQR